MSLSMRRHALVLLALLGLACGGGAKDSKKKDGDAEVDHPPIVNGEAGGSVDGCPSPGFCPEEDGGTISSNSMGQVCPSVGDLAATTLLQACKTGCDTGDGQLCFRSSFLEGVGAIVPGLIPNAGGLLEGFRLAAGDLDSDGRADLVAVFRGEWVEGAFGGRAHALVAYWGLGNGDFIGPEEAVGAWGEDAGDPRIADFDADGRLDIAVTGSGPAGPRLLLYYGIGDRKFEERSLVIPSHESTTVHSGDLNGDGREDVLLDGGILVTGLSGRDHAPHELWMPMGMRVGTVTDIDDLDGNGRRDFLGQLTSAAASAADLYACAGLGEGDNETHSIVRDFASSWPVVIDANEDGIQDIAGLRHTSAIDGDSVQLELRVWLAGTGLEYNQQPVASYLTPLRRDRGFRPVGAGSADVDGDGNLDILFAAGHEYEGCAVPDAWRSVHMALGDGKGGFREPACHPVLHKPALDLDISDFNLDGVPDVAAMTVEGVELLLSD